MFTAVNRTLNGILGKISGDLTDGLQTTDGQTDGPVNWLAAGAGGGGSFLILLLFCIVCYRNLDAIGRLVQSCRGLLQDIQRARGGAEESPSPVPVARDYPRPRGREEWAIQMQSLRLANEARIQRPQLYTHVARIEEV